MKHRIMMLCRLCLFLLFLFISGEVYAGGFYIGGGVSLVTLNSDHPSINDQNGIGYLLFAGTKYDKWGIELAATGGPSFSTGPTPGIYYPEDSAEYTILDLGIKRYFHPKNTTNLSPWIGAGLGLHFIDWSTFYYNVDGYGYSISGGVDYQIDPDWFIRGGAVYHDFKSDDFYEYGPYDDTATQINLVVFFLF